MDFTSSKDPNILGILSKEYSTAEQGQILGVFHSIKPLISVVGPLIFNNLFVSIFLSITEQSVILYIQQCLSFQNSWHCFLCGFGGLASVFHFLGYHVQNVPRKGCIGQFRCVRKFSSFKILIELIILYKDTLYYKEANAFVSCFAASNCLLLKWTFLESSVWLCRHSESIRKNSYQVQKIEMVLPLLVSEQFQVSSSSNSR